MKNTKNIKDVAKLAGVSQACVSKFLNSKPYVSEKTKEKIAKAIKKLNYKPNAIARSLVKRKSNCIGLIIRDITNPFYAGIVKSMENYINSNNLNYYLILVDVQENDKYIDSLLERRVDGIATSTDEISPRYLKYLKTVNIPLLFIGRYLYLPNIQVNFITIDNFLGAYMMTKYLIKLGHKKIAHISGNIKSKIILDRLNGYKTALQDNNIDINPDYILSTNDLNINSGYEAAEQLLTKPDTKRPTAIFCISDFLAFGTYDYCVKNNIKVPEELSIGGFDDNKFSSLGFVSLTTIKQPIDFIGKTAAEILINKIKDGDRTTINKIIEPELIIRKSTGPYKK